MSIHGGMVYDNNVLLDGVNIQDPIFGQVSQGAVNALYIESNIAETQVLTSGISAEYGQFTGGVLNMVTKSGGNEFGGSLRANFSKPSWAAQTPFGESREGDLSTYYEGTFGGPLRRDVAWFNLAARDERSDNDFDANITGERLFQSQEQTRWEVKLTTTLGPSHSLQGSYIDNPTKRSLESQVTPAESVAFARDTRRENDGFVLEARPRVVVKVQGRDDHVRPPRGAAGALDRSDERGVDRLRLADALFEAVAHAAHARDPRLAELLARAPDVHVDDVRAGVEVVSPHLAQQLFGVQHLPGVAEEHFRHRELACAQVIRLPVDDGLARAEVERRVPTVSTVGSAAPGRPLAYLREP